MGDLLVCELHAHSTWSDGYLTLAELIDLHGEAGIDVLCVTDHAVRLEDPSPNAVDVWTWPAYAAAVRAEADRALSDYGLIVITGLELSDNNDDPDLAAHAVAIGLDQYVSMDAGLSGAGSSEHTRFRSRRCAPILRGRLEREARDTPHLARAGCTARVDPSLRAVQSPRGLQLGGRRGPAAGRHGRRPPLGARVLAEDLAAV
jgi:hypothetical protein